MAGRNAEPSIPRVKKGRIFSKLLKPMISNKADRFAGLDFLRGIAILAVFGHHVLYEMLLVPKHMQIGWNGGG
jgi:uncharacterized membrane protein